MTYKIRFEVRTEARSRDCDGPTYHKPTKEMLEYTDLAKQLGFLMLHNGSVEVTHEDGSEWTSVHGYSKTDEGFSEEEIAFREINEEEQEAMGLT